MEMTTATLSLTLIFCWVIITIICGLALAIEQEITRDRARNMPSDREAARDESPQRRDVEYYADDEYEDNTTSSGSSFSVLEHPTLP